MSNNPELGSEKQPFQDQADVMRLLKAGLRTHDVETVQAAIDKAKAIGYPKTVIEDVVLHTVNLLMITENWAFVDDEGNASPLIDAQFEY